MTFLIDLYVTSFYYYAKFSRLSVSWCNRRYVGGKKVFIAVPYQLKACVFLGLLYAIVLGPKVRIALFGMHDGRMVNARTLIALQKDVIVQIDDALFLMSQYRKWRNVCNQPQFKIHPPLHSNPPVRHDADFVLEHYRQLVFERKESSNADVQGIVDGFSMHVVGHFIRRFV